MSKAPGEQRQSLVKTRTWITAIASYTGLLAGFWMTARLLLLERRIGGHLGTSFVSFALLFAPYWFLGFAMAPLLGWRLRRGAFSLMLPGLLGIAHFS